MNKVFKSKIRRHNLRIYNEESLYDDYKESFYQKCTDEYTLEQVKNIEEVREWLKNLLTMK